MAKWQEEKETRRCNNNSYIKTVAKSLMCVRVLAGNHDGLIWIGTCG